ncbi:hypothetical protein LUX73_14200 [Actinomadura madurae]|nr:hypothetical protein [Actinomadura madurae]MCQ0005700.1 hypothetical protein [Actinomadura madurae]
MPLPRRAVDHPEPAQLVVGGDDRRPAHHERLRQDALGGQPLAGVQGAVQHGPVEGGGELAVQRARPARPVAEDLRQLARVAKTVHLRPDWPGFARVHGDRLAVTPQPGGRPRELPP